MKLEVSQIDVIKKLKRIVQKDDLIFVNPETLEIVEQVDLTNLEDATITSAYLMKNEDGTLSWVDQELRSLGWAFDEDNQELIKIDSFDEYRKYAEENK